MGSTHHTHSTNMSIDTIVRQQRHSTRVGYVPGNPQVSAPTSKSGVRDTVGSVTWESGGGGARASPLKDRARGAVCGGSGSARFAALTCAAPLPPQADPGARLAPGSLIKFNFWSRQRGPPQPLASYVDCACLRPMCSSVCRGFKKMPWGGGGGTQWFHHSFIRVLDDRPFVRGGGCSKT